MRSCFGALFRPCLPYLTPAGAYANGNVTTRTGDKKRSEKTHLNSFNICGGKRRSRPGPSSGRLFARIHLGILTGDYCPLYVCIALCYIRELKYFALHIIYSCMYITTGSKSVLTFSKYRIKCINN